MTGEESITVRDIIVESEWIKAIIDKRVYEFYMNSSFSDIKTIIPPVLTKKDCEYSRFIIENKIETHARILLGLTLLLNLEPTFFSSFINAWKNTGKGQAAIAHLGFVQNYSNTLYLPSGLTYLFLAAGNAPALRLEYASIFTEEHFLGKNHVIGLEPHRKGEPMFSGRIFMNEQWMERFMFEKEAENESIKYWSLNS